MSGYRDGDGEGRVIPAPKSVAEILAMRGEGSGRDKDYLEQDEVWHAWPGVWMISPVAAANDVRTRTITTYLTWGFTSRPVYHAEDVQRVTDAIAAGTAVVEPRWRRDTDEGRAAIREFERTRGRRAFLGFLVPLLFIIALIAALVLPPLLLS
ncbi:hypothetical protein GCM10009682_06870 [Luedemannella flava]|uniref:Uncharacterized protein n=1 Tax=Luedemannella flava TaxID=349316 RepID=A0ABP4XLV8_9ACTN